MSRFGPRPLSVRARLLRGIVRDGFTACWHWRASVQRDGYGLILVERRMVLVHRVAFEEFRGPIPKDMEIDHVRAKGCGSRDCFNPDHLEAVTHAENMRRGAQATVTHCKNGHEFIPGSFRLEKAPDGFRRRCLPCKVDYDRARYDPKRVRARTRR